MIKPFTLAAFRPAARTSGLVQAWLVNAREVQFPDGRSSGYAASYHFNAPVRTRGPTAIAA